LLRRQTRTGVVGGFGAARDFGSTLTRFHPITLDDLVRWKESFGGLVVPKGIMRGEGVREMIDAGIDGIIVSNHGGRNLDGARPTLDILPEVVAAADGRVEVYLDGGVRRGTDVLKALALGARAVLIGRPYLFGLAAYGVPGVRRVLELLRRELDQAMIYAGATTIADIDRSMVVHRSVAPFGVPAAGPVSADEEAAALVGAGSTS
jgi:isopentenyl diphosphate isomerase/L-lactate dehydrogenase-like FMN-dependent dehydrogenase